MMIKIDKGVPVPRERRGPKPLYPFRNMEVGDSFAVPLGTRTAIKVQKSVSSCVIAYCDTQHGRGRRYITRIDHANQCVRVWRVEDKPAPLAFVRTHLLRDDDDEVAA